MRIEHEKNTSISSANQKRVIRDPANQNRALKSCRLGWRSLLGSLIDTVCYSLSSYIGISTPPPPPVWSAHYSTTIVTSIGVVFTSSRILRRIFSVTFSPSLQRKPAAVLTESAISAYSKLNCSTKSYALHKDGRIVFVWINGWQNDCPLGQSSVFMLPTKCVKTREMPRRLPKCILSEATSWFVRGTGLLIQTRQARKFSSLVQLIFNHEGVTSASKACICH